MMANEPTLVRRGVNLLALATLAAATAAYVFRAEVSDLVSDNLWKNEFAVKRTWATGTVGTVTLRAERNDSAFLQVSALKAGASTALGVPISFELTNLGDQNNFPNIAIWTLDVHGMLRRKIVFAPAEYAHSKRLEKERIELIIQPLAGERSFTVKVFYGERP